MLVDVITYPFITDVFILNHLYLFVKIGILRLWKRPDPWESLYVRIQSASC
jgi:hypothetical protein